VVEGGAGVDVLEGGDGIDTVSYASAPSGVVADLVTEEVTGGAGSDFLDQFEFLAGSTFNDVLRGDAGNNVIDGRAGVDVCEGGGGADTFFNCP
jgi:Ca2+-binding RTX toxin-like protein